MIGKGKYSTQVRTSSYKNQCDPVERGLRVYVHNSIEYRPRGVRKLPLSISNSTVNCEVGKR